MFLTLAQDDQIVIIDTEEEDIDECELENDKEYINEDPAKLVKQKSKSPNQLVLKVVQVKENVLYFLRKIATFPFIIYHLYKQDIGGQFIIIKQ